MPDSATQSGRQVALVRIFEAAPAQVFEAWVDPAQVALWWGPEEFSTPADSVVIEPRPGGRYDLLMVETRTGESSAVRQEILEVSAPDLLVLRHEPMPEHGLLEPMVTRVEFHEHEGGTRLELTGGPYTPEMSPFVEQGWGEQLDKLVRLLSA